MAHPAVPLPENMDRIRVLAAESTWMSSQLLAEALAQDCRLEVIGSRAETAVDPGCGGETEAACDSPQFGAGRFREPGF